MSQVDVQAHRGLSADHPENTIAAFQAAADAGFTGIELDIRATHDGEVVVLHDASLARTTDGAGRVSDLDYEELRRYQTGVGPVPRLADCFDALAAWKGHWNIEVKAAEAALPALDVVADHGLGGRALFTCFDPDVLDALREAAPQVPRGLLVMGPPDDADLEEAARVGASWLNVDVDFWDADTMKRARRLDLEVGVWTVNDPATARQVVADGAGSVITDTVAVLRALRR